MNKWIVLTVVKTKTLSTIFEGAIHKETIKVLDNSIIHRLWIQRQKILFHRVNIIN